jgi:hypothetical protein
MLFAHLKRILGLGKLRLRGPSGAKDEFLLAATAQNLRKNWRSSSPSQRQSSPHKAERPGLAALMVALDRHRWPLKRRFFITIVGKRAFPGDASKLDPQSAPLATFWVGHKVLDF